MKRSTTPLDHTITIQSNLDALHILIETGRLYIRSLEEHDEKNCFSLFSDPVVMAKYADGNPYTEEKKKERFERWVKRWKNHDPFSAYAVLDKEFGNFVGIIGIGQVTRGEADLFYAMNHSYWGKGYGREMVEAVTQSLIPKLMLRGYTCMYTSLKKIEADVAEDNIASLKILKAVGFKEKGSVYRFNSDRVFFQLEANTLKSRYNSFFTNRNKSNFKKKCYDVPMKRQTSLLQKWRSVLLVCVF